MSNLDFQIERLKEELKQGKLSRDKLAEEVRESEAGLNELQQKLVGEYNDNNNSNQWKVKFEKQYEKNSYLENELLLMREKMEALSKIIDETTTSKKGDQPDLDLRMKIKQLEHEKTVLEGMVKDAEWHLDSESKQLFDLNEKKKEYMLKLNQSLQHSAPLLDVKRHDWMKDRYRGIPENQRILDPRKGPIKKQALIKLPKITTEAHDKLNEKKRIKGKKKSLNKKEKKEALNNTEDSSPNKKEKKEALNNTEDLKPEEGETFNTDDLKSVEGEENIERGNASEQQISTEADDDSVEIDLTASI